jgi:epoxide hydrolase-like predicted phosphatase
MSIKAIIFDFGQVLNQVVDRDADAANRERLAGLLGIPPAELWPYLFEGEIAGRWMTGRLDWDGFWREALAPAGISDAAEIAAFANAVFVGGERIHPEMAALLDELKGHYRLAVLSNASWSEEELRRLLVSDYGLAPGVFDEVITSASAGVVKPDPAIFRLALRRLGVRAKESLFIDDLVSFTRSAAALGIASHTFTDVAGLRRFLRYHGVAVAPPAEP